MSRFLLEHTLTDVVAASSAGFGGINVTGDQSLNLGVDLTLHHHEGVVVLHFRNVSIADIILILMSDDVSFLTIFLLQEFIVKSFGFFLP